MLHTLILADFISLHGHPQLLFSFFSEDAPSSFAITLSMYDSTRSAAIQEAIEPRTAELLCPVGQYIPTATSLGGSHTDEFWSIASS
jgi:hypothetical protein